MTSPESFDAAFRRLFEDGFPSLFRYLHRLCGEQAEAADLAQETFTRLYERGEMPRDPRAWLVTVGANLLRDERRTSLRRRRLIAASLPDGVLGDPAPAPDDRLLREERQRAVRRALEVLTERERRALLLRYEGFSYREVARALGVAESSVGTLLVRAKASFLSAFERLAGASQ
jgi:RNA polymerase sigma factor (sigma-70 family)